MDFPKIQKNYEVPTRTSRKPLLGIQPHSQHFAVNKKYHSHFPLLSAYQVLGITLFNYYSNLIR